MTPAPVFTGIYLFEALCKNTQFGAPIYLSEDVLKQAGFVIRQAKPGGMLQVERVDASLESAMPEKETGTTIDGLLKQTGIVQPDEPLGETKNPKKRLKVLQRRMEQAVKSEHYEDAERIRKEIENIEGSRGNKI